MRFFLDSEFMEDGKSIELISLGIVTESGHEFYVQNANADLKSANSFVKAHVIPRLLPCPSGLAPTAHRASTCPSRDCPWLPYRLISRRLDYFVGMHSKPDGFEWVEPEFWADYAAYDWVVLCFLFGRMVNLPTGWPMFCNDIQQLRRELGGVMFPEKSESENPHDALADAYQTRARWRYLTAADWRERNFKEEPDAGRETAGTVNQKPSNVRGAEARGQVEVASSGDLERGPR